MKKRNKVNLNAYLFANLVILCILLISLWNKKPVWDVNLRLPNLLLILVIINSILIFKNLILSQPANTSTKKGNTKPAKAGKSLQLLRATRLTDFSSESIQKVLEKIRQFSSCECVAIYIENNGFFSQQFKAGSVPSTLSSAILSRREASLWIKFPGNSGEEKICKARLRASPLTFKSSITRLEFTLFPLKMTDHKIGLLVFSNQKKHQAPRISYSGVALYLETLLAFLNVRQNDSKCYDKATGLLKNEWFEESFETEIERSERYQQEMTLMTAKMEFMDHIDENIRSIADRAAASAFKQSLRRLDLIFAGKNEHEFLAILTETGNEVAEIVAGRIQKAFAKYFEKEEIDNREAVKLYIGSASYPTHATHSHVLIEMSADAMQNAIQNQLEYYGYNLNAGE